MRRFPVRTPVRHQLLSKPLRRKVHQQIQLPEQVRIVEVSPRDGLQNEPMLVPTEVKIEFIQRLAECGLPVVETTSFVSPKAVPQMGDAADVFTGVQKVPGVSYPVLTPNMRGLQTAIECGVEEIAVFVGATNEFCKANINADTVDDALKRFEDVVVEAKKANLLIRGYVSCVCGCPYKGYVDPLEVAYASRALHDMGCFEISLGDTIGVGTPGSTEQMLDAVMQEIDVSQIAVHFHNTYAGALANILRSVQMGITTVDASVSGIGGCPFAKKASGNVPTEDVIYMLEGMGINTGVNLEKLIETGEWICNYLGKSNHSNVALAYLSQPKEVLDELKEESKKKEAEL